MSRQEERIKEELKADIKGLTIQQKGELIWELEKEFYIEKPVDIKTFYSDKYFLGNSLPKGLYPIWQNLLQTLYPSPFLKRYSEVILQAPFGSGKSYDAVISIEYELYRLGLKYNPQDYYDLGSGTPIICIIFSFDLGSANINWSYARNFMAESPFFQGAIKQSTRGKQLNDSTKSLEKNTLHLFKDVYLSLGSHEHHATSRAIHSYIMDESDFQNKRKNQAQNNYDQLVNRVESRFGGQGPVLPGIGWLLSSATLEVSFMTERMAIAKGLKTTFVVPSFPLWEIKKEVNNYSGETFQVFAGNGVLDPFIVDEEKKANLSPTMKLISVPIEHFDPFYKNVKKALRDLANIRINADTGFCKSKERLNSCMTLPNRFTKEIIEIDFYDPEDTLIKYVKDLDYFKKPIFPWAYRYLHIDLGRKKDRFAIASAFAIYENEELYKTPEKIDFKAERRYYIDFIIALQAKKGQQINYDKVKDFLILLKRIGYPIKLTTTDQREGGANLQQNLEIAGINSGYQSVDRTRDAYDLIDEFINYFKILMPVHNLFFREYTELIDKDEKIDHPEVSAAAEDGRGSKDATDAGAGAIKNCFDDKNIFNPYLYAEENPRHPGTGLTSVLKQQHNQNKMKGINNFFGKKGY
jgi:hypothetical protein